MKNTDVLQAGVHVDAVAYSFTTCYRNGLISGGLPIFFSKWVFSSSCAREYLMT